METISSPFSRRALLRNTFAVGASVLTAGSLLGHTAAQDDAALAASAYYRTTDYVNFRTGPGLDYGVIRVLPPNSPLTSVGASSGYFIKVSNQGDIGWVHRDYAGPGNGGSADYPPSLGYKSTTAYVNMRSGPSTGYSVIRTLPYGTQVEVFDAYEANFQMVGYAQQAGWISLDYLSGGGGDGGGSGQPIGQLRVTSALNLRTNPSLSAGVLRVMPAGTMVWPSEQLSDGFRYVDLVDGSDSGWAYDDYLA